MTGAVLDVKSRLQGMPLPLVQVPLTKLAGEVRKLSAQPPTRDLDANVLASSTAQKLSNFFLPKKPQHDRSFLRNYNLQEQEAPRETQKDGAPLHLDGDVSWICPVRGKRQENSKE